MLILLITITLIFANFKFKYIEGKLVNTENTELQGRISKHTEYKIQGQN